MYVSEQSELFDYLRDPEVRHLYLDSTIRQLIAMQLRSMREERRWSQTEVGDLAGGMKQPAIARLEDPSYTGMTLATLKRLAKAFDVALIVRFAAFSEFVDWTVQLNSYRLSPPEYREDHKAWEMTGETDASSLSTKRETKEGKQAQRPDTADKVYETERANVAA
jgi:transcriptional regulator with XRE-family HTH domain